jgi:acyl-CoA synthetase (AMP-forming)/AMP-acid ligase II
MSGLVTKPLTVEKAARICQLRVTQIEEIYPCTPQQVTQISGNRSEVFHLILSFSQHGDMKRWSRCVCEVVALNSILRTRIVYHQGQHLQVVTTEQHATEQISGTLERYVEGEMPHHMSLGQPLFRTIAIGNHFVATMHHAIMDYWSLNSFLRGDAAMLYLGHEPIQRAPFKDFVSLCASIDRSKADSFWAPRFSGYPSTFPAVSADTFVRPSSKMEKTMTLDLDSMGISESHVAWYAEAAWALTIAAYVDNESVSYGNVMSGRSPMLGDAGNTLGPTTVEIPVQVNVQPNVTIDTLVKGRATALRELKAEPLLLQYGLTNIAAISEAASMATKFQSLFNIVPPQPISLPTTDEQEKSVALDNVVKRSRGGFALTLICRLVEDDIMLEALYDPAVLATKQIQRLVNQFEHDLLSLIHVSPSTRISRLQRLNPHDRLDILEWNASMSHGFHNPSSTDKLLGRGLNEPLLNLIKIGCGTWIVDPRNTDSLVPVGSIGELLVEVPLKRRGSVTHSGFRPMTNLPLWFDESCGKPSCFFKTGHLVSYNHDGVLSAVGKQENRIKVAGRIVQIEQVEETIGTCEQVLSVVVVPKIVAGRTRLIVVLTLEGFGDQDSDQEPLRPLPAEVSQAVEGHLGSVQKYASTHLIIGYVPSAWHVVGHLPHLEDGSFDRAAVRHWLKLLK